MNKETVEEAVSAFSASDSASMQRIIGRTFIVEYGVITKVLGKGVVEVAPSVVDKDVNLQLFVCTLISPCSKTFSIDIEPQEGDKVLVLFPRRFNNEMFDSDKTEPIVNEFSNGYNALCGLAILMNQFREDDAEHYIKITKDEEITVTAGKTTIQIDKDSNVEINTNGKYTIKNNNTDLKDVIDGLAKELENLTTTGTPATQATSPASKGTIATWRTGKLNNLFK